MKRQLTAAAAAIFALALSAGAQTVISTHPASAGGKEFSMADVTVSRDVYPEQSRADWISSERFIFRTYNSLFIYTKQFKEFAVNPAGVI